MAECPSLLTSKLISRPMPRESSVATWLELVRAGWHPMEVQEVMVQEAQEVQARVVMVQEAMVQEVLEAQVDQGVQAREVMARVGQETREAMGPTVQGVKTEMDHQEGRPVDQELADHQVDRQADRQVGQMGSYQ